MLVGIEDIWLLGGEPRKHLVEFRLVGPMAENHNLSGSEGLARQEIVEVHALTI